MGITNNIINVPLEDITISDHNVRIDDPEPKINELADSIADLGLLQPIIVIETGKKPKYEVVVGQRRYKAHLQLRKRDPGKYYSIKAIVYEGKITDTNLKILSLAENLQRVELNYKDTANAITSLFIALKRAFKTVAKRLGISEATVRDYVRVEESATPKIKRLLDKNIVKKEQAKRVLKAAHGDGTVADKIIDELIKYPVYAQEKAADYGASNPTSTAEEILREAFIPKEEESVLLHLNPRSYSALKKAGKDLSISTEGLALKVLNEWLIDNKYLKRME